MALKQVKELLTTGTGTQGTLLLPRKIYGELIEEVDKNVLPRSFAGYLFGPGEIPGSSIDLNLTTANSMDVFKVAEGAEVPMDQEAYTNLNIKPDKYGVSVKITSELLEDSMFPLLAKNMKKAGKLLAENETSLIITALDGAANTVSGGAAITIANITRAMQYLEDSDHKARVMLIGPEVLNDLRNIDTFVEADKLGSREMLQNGFVGTIFGMQVFLFSANAAPTTTYSKYAYVIDTQEAYAIAEKRPATLQYFDETLRDMSGAVVTQRLAVSLVKSAAVARVTTS